LNNELEELKQQKQQQRQRLAKITTTRRTTTKKTQTPNFANSLHKLLPFSNTVAEPKAF
jgi:hypothetical protein